MKTNQKVATLAMLMAVGLSACTETTKTETVTLPPPVVAPAAPQSTEQVVTQSATDKDGNKLDIVFDNAAGKATIDFNGTKSELLSQKPASGIWYQNSEYELRGKGNDLELKKAGKVVFTYQDDLVNSSLKDKEGRTLDMTFNNTTNTVKIYLNGGEQIELDGQRPASGIWYKNDQYELRGKGENLELTKDGAVVFKS